MKPYRQFGGTHVVNRRGMVWLMRGALQAQKMIDLLPQMRAADFRSVDVQNRTAELIFSTGAPVERYDWRSGTRYVETLSMKPMHVLLDRLNAGASLLDAHAAYSVNNILGSVVRGSARVEKGEALAVIKFSLRDDADVILRDLEIGVAPPISTAYRVHRFEETKTPDGGVTRHATQWEPFEVSMVPIPADPSARVRGATAESGPNRCLIVPDHRDLGLRLRCRIARLRAHSV